MFRLFEAEPHRGLTLPLLEEGGLVRHLFGFRGPDPRLEISREFGVPEDAVLSFPQVHRDGVCVLKQTPGTSSPPDPEAEFDALITDRPGVILTVRTADCVPLLLWDPGKKVSGAVHAGWRGSILEISEKTIRKMKQVFGSSPEDILAGIGPAASSCCYEVDGTVLDPLKKKFDYWRDVVTGEEDGRGRLDLAGLNRRQLMNA
ncbi:MAG TPA: polyphenol oxidase family protein, partial [Nitrospiria bacterium]